MALSAVYVFQANTTLFAAQLNAMNNNILQNPIALVSPTSGPINFNLQNHVNLPITALSATSGSTGQVLTYVGGVPTWSSGAFPTVSATPFTGSYVRGLTGGTTGNLSTGLATFAFTEAVLRTTASTASYYCSATSAFTVNISTGLAGSGASALAGGRDIASTFGANRMIHCYAITTGLNSTAPSGLGSTTPPNTGPVMPTSYSAWVYLMPVFYSPDSVFVPTIIRGATATYGSVTSSDGTILVTTSGTQSAGASHAVTYSGVIPATAAAWDLLYQVESVGAAEPITIWLDSSNDVAYANSIHNVATYIPLTLPMPNQASGSFKFAVTGVARVCKLQVLNYRVSNGDA